MNSLIFNVPELQFLDEMEHIMARSKMSFRDSFFTWKLSHVIEPVQVPEPTISEEVDPPYAPVTPPGEPVMTEAQPTNPRIKFGSRSWAKVVEQSK